MSAASFRLLLENGDVEGCRRHWRETAPEMPQPGSREQAEVVMHIARTAARSVDFKHRAYSHRWLTERGHPSQLPDALQPAADRIYPQVVEAVGISVNFSSPHLAPAAKEIEAAMSEAVRDCYANNETNPAFVQARMREARSRALKALFGRTESGTAI